MSNINYSEMAIDQILKRFEQACLEQYDTYSTGKTKKHNINFWILVSITDELKARGSEARKSLSRLLSDENPQVRLQAATFVYPAAPEKAKARLKDIRMAKLPDQSLDAGMTLRGLEDDPHCLDD